MTHTDLTTLADVKAWLQTGQSAFPTTDDALLSRLITAASEYIQTWLNRRIALTDYIEIRDGTGGQRLQFACFPVCAVLSLTIDGIAIPPAPPPSPSSGSTAGYLFLTDAASRARLLFCARDTKRNSFVYCRLFDDTT